MTKVTEYVREECIPKKISPEGVEYDVFRIGENDLYEVSAVLVDEMEHRKPDGRRSRPFSGTFTGFTRAHRALTQWLTMRWDAADSAKLKKMTPSQRVAANA